MSTTETNKTNVQALIEGITTGRLLEAFERFYADDVVMSENGVHDEARVGKTKNRAYEEAFVGNSTWHGVKIGPVIADGDTTAYEMWMDATVFGNRVTRTQWAVQQWRDGKIVKETFFYAA